MGLRRKVDEAQRRLHKGSDFSESTQQVLLSIKALQAAMPDAAQPA